MAGEMVLTDSRGGEGALHCTMMHPSPMSIITPDGGLPNPFRRKIVKSVPIEGTRSGKHVQLSCGHMVTAYGDLELAPDEGVVCEQCRAERVLISERGKK